MPDSSPKVRVRLSGITALVRRLRQQLASGTPAAAHAVGDQAGRMLAAVEALFSAGKVDPASLTPASKKAYLDLKNIYTGQPRKTARRLQKIRLSGKGILHLNGHIDRIQMIIAETTSESPEADTLMNEIGRLAGAVQSLCVEAAINPAELNPPSASSYAWLVFLSKPGSLSRHLAAQERFNKAVESLAFRKTVSYKALFCAQAATYRYERNRTHMTVRINEGFIDAPLEVLRALAATASGSRSQAARRTIAAYTIGPEYLAVTRALAGVPSAEGQSQEVSQLVEIFDRLNVAYFDGKLPRPHLAWTKRESQRVLGTYAPATDTILISRSLQKADTPADVLDYVVYHEMLHKLLGTRLAGRTRRVHTAEFRRREALFAGFNRVQAAMHSPVMAGRHIG